MWPNDFASLMISMFNVVEPAHQGAIVMMTLGGYAGVICAVVGGAVFILENLNK
jgi:hypothetical protein